jgi:hypothetical protein
MNNVKIYRISEHGFNKREKRELKDPEISHLLQKNEKKQISALDNTNIIYYITFRLDGTFTFKRQNTNFEKKISMKFTEKQL